jgi:Subtilase family
VKPDVVASGVGLPTVQPGADPDGTSHFVTVSGTSAAAATAAGAAALVLQVRPSLSAADLRGVLVGSARRLAAQPTTAQGAGLLDPGSAAVVQVATVPASISFGRGGAVGPATRDVIVRNLSARPLAVYVGAARRPRVTVAVRPRRLQLSAGASARVRVQVSVAGAQAPAPQAVTGTLSVAPLGGAPLRVPWSVVLDHSPQQLLGPLALTRSSFQSSDPSPSFLALRVGRVERHSGLSAVEPVPRLDVQLRDASGKLLGLLTRVRDVLPGRYVFGLTGHDPNGKRLPPGVYKLRLVAWPAAGGRASVRSIEFRIE